MEVPTLEPDKAYALWAETYPARAHNPLMLTEERALLSLLPDNLCGCHVLDAGCGSGRYTLHAQLCGARRVIGVDFSFEMLCRAREEALPPQILRSEEQAPEVALLQASVAALPVQNGWADVTLCALTLGHLPDLLRPLAELRRVTRPGGLVLCSDFHPVGDTLGWKRNFKANGQRYAIRYTAHTLDAWQAACRTVGLTIERVLEPYLDPTDVPQGAQFEPSALQVPIALALRLRRPE